MCIRDRCSENEVISGCDFLSLHLPLNDETRNMISAPQLASMKAGAYVINAARGLSLIHI